MKKLKNITKRIATLGLAAVLTVNSFPATAFAAEESSGGVFSDLYTSAEREWSRGEPETAVIMEEELQESNSELITDAAESDVDENVKQDESKDSEKDEAKFPAFEESKSIDGVKITVSAEEGVFPEGAVLFVEKVTIEQEKQAEEAVEDKRPDEQNVAVSYTYDIKVLDKDGNEIQPADERKVKMSFKLEKVADDNLTTNVYHITEKEEGEAENTADADSGELVAEKLEVETDGDTAIAETDGFSLYTVEFTYNDLQYVLPGDSEVALSQILSTVGLSGEVSEVSVSDSSLFSATENDSGEWIVTAHRAFSTKEWMKLTINDVVYEITVTDTDDILLGDGSAETPYTISSTDDWNTFANRVTGGETFEGKYVQLSNDFDNSASPITTTAGYKDKPFKGTFDGRGRTIHVNLSASSTTDGKNVALFGSISGATIQNVKVEGNITSNNYNIGTFAGQVQGSSTIKKCWSGASVSSTKENDADCGAMVGFISKDGGTLSITNCAFTGSIALSGYEGGGFAGWISSNNSNSPQISNSLFAPSAITAIQKDNEEYVFVSGDKRATLDNCYYNSVTKASALNKEGIDASEMTNDALLAALGSGWEISDGKVVPCLVTNNLASAAVSGIMTNYVYTGNEISIDYTVTALDGTTLTKDIHFTETITKDGETAEIKEKGNYILTITGKSPYVGSQKFDITVDDYLPVTSTTTVMDNCPYKVLENVNIDGRINVNGNVTLTLEEGCKLYVKRGIEVVAGNTLTIEGTGSLEIPYGNSDCAGIGGSGGKEYGHIIINGGNIKVHGYTYGAGIGGGKNNADNGNSSITINGGVINASGGQDAAGIGGGYKGAAGRIVINGGQVTASGYEANGSIISHCGIGKGESSNDNKGSLTLDWTRESDFINAFSYDIMNITFGGKDFVLDEDNTVIATKNNIGGKKIVPKLDNLVLNHATINNLYSLYRYTGNEITLGYTIKSTGGTTLVKGTDYSETIKKGNETVTTIQDKGEYTLTITGLGDTYTGTKSYTFSVVDFDEDLSLDGNELYVNLPADGSTKTVDLSEGQTIKVYDSEGNIGALKVSNGYLLLQAPEGYAFEVTGKTDAMKYNATQGVLTNSMAAYEGNDTEKEIIYLQSNDDNILFSSDGNVMLIQLNVPNIYHYAPQYGLDLTIETKKKDYDITYDLAGGSVATTNPATYTYITDAFTLTNPTREGYEFAGWTGTGLDAASTSVTIAKGSKGDRSYTATWKKLLTNSDITVEKIEDQAVTGSEIKPAVTVKDGTTDITAQCNFAYSNNTEVGQATVTITAKDTSAGYAGSRTVNFNIVTHVHHFTYAANGAVITATCDGAGSCELDDNKIALTITAPKKTTYGDGKSASATLTGLEGFNSVTKLNTAASDIKYVGRGDTAYTESATAPTEAGTYTASITAGGKTASVDYTIAQKEIGLNWTNTSLTYTGSPQKPTATATGLIEGDAAWVSVTVTGEETDAGTNYTATATGLTGAKAGNYKLPSANTQSFSIGKADATISTGTTAFTKAFGDEPFALEGIIATPADAALVYSVTGSKNVAGNTVNDNKVITVNASGTVTIVGAGTATVKIDLPESTNYNAAASKTISVTVSKKAAPTIDAINKTYLYSAGGEDSVTLSALLPADCGAVSYAVATTGDVTYSAEPTVTNGVLSYTVNPGEINKTGTITVTATTENYADITITVNVKLADQKPVTLKDGTSVTLSKSTLTYGEALSTLTFKDTAVFVEQGNESNEILGTIAWKNPSEKPAVGTTSAAWVFTPTDTAYAPLEGIAPITVNKATPVITTVPTAAAITYGHTLANSNLENGAAKLGETNVPGTFAWSDDTIAPAVSDSNKTEYTVKFTPDDSGNYNEATCKVKIVVNKAEISPENITAPQPKPDLKYTGSAQALITAGSCEYGAMHYAVTATNTAPTDESLYTTTIPTGTNAGTYYVWYKVIGDANHNDYVPETAVSVEIVKATYTGTKEASVTVRSGQATSNMTVALPALPDGASYGTVTVGGTTALISDTPTVNGTILTFSTTEQNDQTTATITIVVIGATNYNDYDVVVTVTAKAKDETVVTITGIPPIAIEYGDTIVLSGSVQNPGTNGTWTWTSNDSEVLRVTPDGANVTIEMMKVGTATITAKYESDTTLGEAQISLTVSPKQLGISWSNTSFTYDGESHIPTATLSGVMSGDTCTVSVTGAQINAGSHTATASLTGTASSNYTLPANRTTCSFTISKANISSATVALGAPLTYTGTEQTQSVSKVELSGEDITAYCDVSDNKGTNAGSYTLTVTAKADSNYTGSVRKTFTIAKKAITPTVSVTGSYSYTGSAITPDYSVKSGGVALATSDYTASIKDNINAGEGKLTVTAATGGNYSFDPVTVSFTIAKAAHENVQAGGELKYGLSGTVALASYIEAGGSMGTVSVSDASSVLSGTPSINGTTLSYSFADNAENAGKTAVVTVPVKDCTNYADYSILVTLTVIDCAHEHTEIRDIKTASCTEQGYTGDTYCKDCGKKLQSGEAIPIDPDNHSYDDGVITKQPTIFAEGIRTYTCTRCHHTYTETVPKVDDGEDHSDLIEDITDEEGKTKAEVKTEDKEDGSKETTVTVGGQEVEKTVTDAEGNETVETHIWIGGLKSSYTYTGSAIKPSFHVYDGTKKLISGTDYSVSYKNNKNAGDTATIMISFKGNYKGTAQEKLSFSITPAVLGADVEATDVTTYAAGKTLRPVPVMKWASTGKSIDKKNFSFTYKDSADTVIDGIKEAGQYKVVITSKSGSFTGETEAAITVTGSKKLLLSGATVKLSPNKYTYTGAPITPAKDSYTLKLNGKMLTEGTDYVVSVRNNIEPGKATIVFTAKDGNQEGYVGEKSATFTISKGRALKDGDGFTYSYSESVPYAKGGAKPTVVVKDGDDTLKAGTDYTISYSKNTKVTNGATAVITITGKGNYKGSVKKYFTITAQDIEKLKDGISVDDKTESKKGYKNPTVTITDLDGKKLKAGTDFAIDSDSYSGPDTNGVVTATVSGKGNYTGTAIITYRYIKGAQQLSKVKAMKSLANKTYTGREVRLTNADLTGILYTGSKNSPVYLIPGTDFKVVSYTNNTKTGTAKVTIQGIGVYGGTRTLSFKIIAKQGDYKGSLVGGEWTKVQ